MASNIISRYAIEAPTPHPDLITWFRDLRVKLSKRLAKKPPHKRTFGFSPDYGQYVRLRSTTPQLLTKRKRRILIIKI